VCVCMLERECVCVCEREMKRECVRGEEGERMRSKLTHEKYFNKTLLISKLQN